MEAITQNPESFRFAKIQTELVCQTAIKGNPRNIAWVNEQLPDLCLLAVTLCGLTIQFIKEQSEALCITAVSENPLSLQLINEQTEAVCMAAVRRDGKVLSLVKEQTPLVCIEAIKQNPEAIHAITIERDVGMYVTAISKDASYAWVLNKRIPRNVLRACYTANQDIIHYMDLTEWYPEGDNAVNVSRLREWLTGRYEDKPSFEL